MRNIFLSCQIIIFWKGPHMMFFCNFFCKGPTCDFLFSFFHIMKWWICEWSLWCSHVISSAEKFIHIAVMDYSPSFLFAKNHQFWPIIDNLLRKGEFLSANRCHWLKKILSIAYLLASHSNSTFNSNLKDHVVIGMPIPWRVSFLGDSGNRGMAIWHSLGTPRNPQKLKRFPGIPIWLEETNCSCIKEALYKIAMPE